jgi:hypothetical protein
MSVFAPLYAQAFGFRILFCIAAVLYGRSCRYLSGISEALYAAWLSWVAIGSRLVTTSLSHAPTFLVP